MPIYENGTPVGIGDRVIVASHSCVAEVASFTSKSSTLVVFEKGGWGHCGFLERETDPDEGAVRYARKYGYKVPPPWAIEAMRQRRAWFSSICNLELLKRAPGQLELFEL